MQERLESMDLKQPKIKILIADDHPLVRHALKNILEKAPDFQIVGEANNGQEALEFANDIKPDVVIMDISMPILNGLEATRQIKRDNSNIAILVLTIHEDDDYILGILEAGAAGYLVKSVFGDEVIQAVRAVIAGEMVLSDPIGKRVLQLATRYPTKPLVIDGGESLSTKEIEVLKLASLGLSNKMIAVKLDISLRTVKGHFVDIFSKLRVASRTEAVIKGLRMGLISLDES
ncbi:MAG TPA: DNA-binding response regulator [Prolixibacteraceae bacterium]|nr:DNA-binding response regulator [Prolixibacteraceae bacterium]